MLGPKHDGTFVAMFSYATVVRYYGKYAEASEVEKELVAVR